jgi:phthiocerol/phenolphthiocerol synthesis type-I polyketide synthase E
MSSAIPMAQNFAAGDDATQHLTRIWENLLGVRPIEPHQNYFDLGGDSLLAVQMFAQIEAVFQVSLPIATLFEAPTIADLAQIVEREAPKSRTSSMVPIQPKGSRPPFFCMHGAGGNVLIYRELSQRLGEDQPFYGLQSQGLDGSVEPPTRIEDMASVYVREIKRVQPRGPYYLGGYCLGGTIAYEIAQQLQAQGEQVALLALFDTLNWCKIPPLSMTDKASIWFERIVFHVLNYMRLDGRGKQEFLSEKYRVLRNRIPVWRGTLASKIAGNSSAAKSKLVTLGKIWTGNDKASMDYVPKPYPGVLTDFRPIRQYTIFQRPDVKFEELAQGGQKIVQLPVYPAGMMVEPFVKLLADALKKTIDSAMNS